MEAIIPADIRGLPRIIFGAGTFSGLRQIIETFGSRALIVTGGESLAKSGRLDILTRQLGEARINCSVAAVRGEPTTQCIDDMVREFRAAAVNVVVAVGGGSVIDCGKAVSAMLTETGSVKDYLEDVGVRKPAGTKIPFLAVPTTAGTGSEATKNAVVCDRTAGYKKSLRHDAFMPDVALVDPELTLTSPRHINIACGLDAVSQLIESHTSARADKSLDGLTLKALSAAFSSFPPLALGRSNDLALRTGMSYAALISGIALGRAGLGAVHGIAGPLGGLIPVPHGLACGKLLFPVLSFVVKKVIDEENTAARKRFADIGRLFTGDAGRDDVFYCRQFLDVLHKWTQALRLPQISHFGMTAAHMRKVVELAGSKNSPAPLSREEIKVILEIVR
ncbi:MAG: iron-containing alcohol dehydrogenase [Deltaproteobacteria bacterium]|nr:iron-containing alcohol dehydrogenase [Deltaproteobacteria bacterium]